MDLPEISWLAAAIAPVRWYTWEMEEVAKHPRLQCREGTYYIRVKVPKDVVRHIGKAEVLRSLRTKDYHEALKRLRRASAEIDAQFEEARLRPTNNSGLRFRSQNLPSPSSSEIVTSLSEPELQQLAKAWLVQRDRWLDRGPSISAMTSAELQGALENSEQDLDWLRGGQDDEQLLASMQGSALKLLASRNINLDPTSSSFRALVDLLIRAEIVGLRRDKAKLQRDFSPQSIDPLFDGVTGEQGAPISSAGGGMKLSDLFERYVTDPGRTLTDRSSVSYRAKFRVIKEIMGDRTIDAIRREDCKRVQAALNIYPVHAHLKFPNVSAPQVVEIAQREQLEPLHPKTATGYLVLMSSLFEFAVREELMQRNPATGLAVTREPNGKSARRPFSIEQLRRIFSSSHYFRGVGASGAGGIQRGRGLDEGHFWVPLIGLFTGMRLNECCQLLTSDVAKEEGVWVIHVRPDNDQRKKLKTRNAQRWVPVHPELAKLGFLSHVRERQSKGGAELFPDLPIGARGNYSDPFQKWFRRFLTAVGVTEPGASFHSFRHTFRDALRNALIHDEATRWLGGWSPLRGAQNRYGDGFGFGILERVFPVSDHETDLIFL